MNLACLVLGHHMVPFWDITGRRLRVGNRCRRCARVEVVTR